MGKSDFTILDIDRKSSLVEERLPSNIRSFGALEAVSVNVQHDHHVYLKSDSYGGDDPTASRDMVSAAAICSDSGSWDAFSNQLEQNLKCDPNTY